MIRPKWPFFSVAERPEQGIAVTVLFDVLMDTVIK